MNQTDSLDPQLKRIQVFAIALGVLGVAICTAGAFLDPASFFHAYLVAFLYWMGIALGCLALLMVHSITSGRWGVVVQRLLAAGARTLPLMALLFVPLLAGLNILYPWATQDVTGEELLLDKSLYLNVPFFLVRAAIYFGVWSGLAYTITHYLYRNDETGDEALLQKAKRLSVAGLIVYFLTASFAAIDWSMSLEPSWFSSVYGWLSISRQALAALALAVTFLGLLWRREPLARVVSPRIVQELGMLLLTALLLWIYLEFIQYLVIWYGNVPEEVRWYHQRSTGGWEWVALSLVVFHFAVPLFLLLIPGLKQRITILAATAALVVMSRLVELFWVVKPSFAANFSLHWLDLALPLALGGLWIATFTWQLRQRSLLPLSHPKLSEALEPEEQKPYGTARSPF